MEVWIKRDWFLPTTFAKFLGSPLSFYASNWLLRKNVGIGTRTRKIYSYTNQRTWIVAHEPPPVETRGKKRRKNGDKWNICQFLHTICSGLALAVSITLPFPIHQQKDIDTPICLLTCPNTIYLFILIWGKRLFACIYMYSHVCIYLEYRICGTSCSLDIISPSSKFKYNFSPSGVMKYW